MSVRNLSGLFAPERIAVIGAGPDAGNVGGIVLENLAGGGFTGIVHPIHPHHRAVHGIEAHRNIAALPAPPDLAVICTPAATVPGLVQECGDAGVRSVVVISAGFREVGPGGAALERHVAEVAAGFEGMRVLGPNCLGYLVPGLGLNASFARAQPRAGNVGLISQSGALITSVLDWAEELGIGFSAVVSAGNMLDVDLADLIDHLADDPATQSLILYVESVTNPRAFMSAARAFARTKPIVAYKSGRYVQSAQAAVSHTGALAGADDVYDAAFRRAGIVRVHEIDEIFEATALIGRHRGPRGDRVAIVTNAGGPGVMCVDALIERGGVLATLDEMTIAALNGSLPSHWSHANPVDVLGDAPPERFGDAVRAVLQDGAVDALLVVLTPQAMTEATATADVVIAAAASTRKPVLAVWMGGAAVRDGREHLERAGVPTYRTPEKAVGAFMHLASYVHRREMLYETPRAIPVTFDLDRARARALISCTAPEEGGVLSEPASKALLDAYGIAVTSPRGAPTVDDAVRAAHDMGYPVVLKVDSPEVTHKSDVGGVVTGIVDEAGVRAAFASIAAGLAEGAPEAQMAGVTVQEMVGGNGRELILGARVDPTFGAVIMVGAGGVNAEILGDTVLELPPLNERLARGMLERLTIWPLLQGYRGRPGVDLDGLLEVLMRFSYLVADHPEIAEIEINPLLAGPDGSVALDARVVLSEGAADRPLLPFEHLAIRPYPEELTTQEQLRDGTPVTLRPIKPEDEPLWLDMLKAASEDSLRSRFRSLFKPIHQMATRYCFIDYDREMAIVAEAQVEGATRLLGVGRLAAGPDLVEAEYAAFVSDPWQGQGLSSLLTDRCLQIARMWNLQRVWAETDPTNRRMLAVFEHRGFTLTPRPEEGVVAATLSLGN